MSDTRKHDELAARLTANFGEPTRYLLTSTWKTPYGFKILDAATVGNDFYYQYDNGITTNPDLANDGPITCDQLTRVLDTLVHDPSAFSLRPISIISLEAATGVQAQRHPTAFGAWQLVIEAGNEPVASMINNPFGTAPGYTRTADEFELYFYSNGEIHKYAKTAEVIERLKERGLA